MAPRHVGRAPSLKSSVSLLKSFSIVILLASDIFVVDTSLTTLDHLVRTSGRCGSASEVYNVTSLLQCLAICLLKSGCIGANLMAPDADSSQCELLWEVTSPKGDASLDYSCYLTERTTSATTEAMANEHTTITSSQEKTNSQIMTTVKQDTTPAGFIDQMDCFSIGATGITALGFEDDDGSIISSIICHTHKEVDPSLVRELHAPSITTPGHESCGLSDNNGVFTGFASTTYWSRVKSLQMGRCSTLDPGMKVTGCYWKDLDDMPRPQKGEASWKHWLACPEYLVITDVKWEADSSNRPVTYLKALCCTIVNTA